MIGRERERERERERDCVHGNGLSACYDQEETTYTPDFCFDLEKDLGIFFMIKRRQVTGMTGCW
jgi:hypothetical protein